MTARNGTERMPGLKLTYYESERYEDRVGLYLHIPFCVRKCLYCDFLSGPAGPEKRQRYVDALLQEIREKAARMREGITADTVYFGGGTPSLLTENQAAEILETLRGCFSIRKDAEISMECNPGTVTEHWLREMRRLGVNRLSIGVQSFDAGELRTLGRIHSPEEAASAVELARAAGFDNLNLDLMSGIPGQNMESWEYSLDRAVRLSPEHISAYSLIVEEGTPFYRMYGEGTEKDPSLPGIPDEETERAMVHFTGRFLAAHGLAQYEISNFARPGRECLHNIGYWKRHPYLGLGAGAASLFGNERFTNIRDVDRYCRAPGREYSEGPESLTREEQMEEFMFLGLRMTEGISEALFAKTFGVSVQSVYGTVIAAHEREGLLVRDGGRIRLTERGMDLSNYVMADFLFC